MFPSSVVRSTSILPIFAMEQDQMEHQDIRSRLWKRQTQSDLFRQHGPWMKWILTITRMKNRFHYWTISQEDTITMPKSAFTTACVMKPARQNLKTGWMQKLPKTVPCFPCWKGNTIRLPMKTRFINLWEPNCLPIRFQSHKSNGFFAIWFTKAIANKQKNRKFPSIVRKQPRPHACIC